MNNGKTKPVSIRLEEETHERLEKLKSSSGMTAEQTVALLLDSYESQDPAIILDCPKLSGPRRELPVVQKSLQAALDSVVSAICLAEQESAQVQLEAKQAIEQTQFTITNLSSANTLLKQELQIATTRQTELEATINDTQLNVRTLREQAESVALLKETWAGKEIEMSAQIEDLNKTAEKISQLQAKHDEIVHSLNSTEYKLLRTEDELNNSRHIISTLQEKIDSEISQKISLNTQISELNAETRSLNKHISLLESGIIEKNKSIHTIEELLEQEKKLRIRAEQAYAVSLAKIEGLEASLHKAEMRLQNIENNQRVKKSKPA